MQKFLQNCFIFCFENKLYFLNYILKYFINWSYISINKKLSESFIKEHKDLVNWSYISQNQQLSESFIIEHKDLVDWFYISRDQVFSESFIKEHKDLVYWEEISQYQKISESFIKEHKHLVDWFYISKYQKLSESFIREHKILVYGYEISRHQQLSDEFWNEFKDKLGEKPSDNLLYWTNEQKLDLLKKYPQYRIDEEGYVYAFKGIRSDRYSKYNFQFKYLKGETYECHADHNLDEENSYGLSCWTYEKAKEYCDQLVIEVRFKVEDLAAIVHDGGKLRVKKFEVLS